MIVREGSGGIDMTVREGSRGIWEINNQNNFPSFLSSYMQKTFDWLFWYPEESQAALSLSFFDYYLNKYEIKMLGWGKSDCGANSSDVPWRLRGQAKHAHKCFSRSPCPLGKFHRDRQVGRWTTLASLTCRSHPSLSTDRTRASSSTPPRPPSRRSTAGYASAPPWRLPTDSGLASIAPRWSLVGSERQCLPHSRFYLAQLLRERQAGKGAGRGYIRLDYTRGRQAGRGYITWDYTREASRQAGVYHIRLYVRGRQAGGISH